MFYVFKSPVPIQPSAASAPLRPLWPRGCGSVPVAEGASGLPALRSRQGRPEAAGLGEPAPPRASAPGPELFRLRLFLPLGRRAPLGARPRVGPGPGPGPDPGPGGAAAGSPAGPRGAPAPCSPPGGTVPLGRRAEAGLRQVAARRRVLVRAAL